MSKTNLKIWCDSVTFCQRGHIFLLTLHPVQIIVKNPLKGGLSQYHSRAWENEVNKTPPPPHPPPGIGGSMSLIR